MKNYIYTKDESQNIFFTSDTHFSHANILKYCKRPFANIDEHDKELIYRWNNVVPKDGIVFHLGDVAFGSSQRVKEILSQLNGKIHLVIGNHDWRRIVSEHAWRFENMTQQINMRIDGRHTILNHYPLLCFSGSYRGADSTYQLFGHVHTSPYTNDGLDNSRMQMLFPTQYDVGVDNNDYAPISWNTVNNIIQRKLKENA